MQRVSAVDLIASCADARRLEASFPRTLYVGVTSGLTNRLSLHREDVIGGFTQKYGVHRLVWFEKFEDMRTAIGREKQIKKWHRVWKLRLIERHNPQWRDLWEEIV
jgi:putative endonuclease